jgi:lauroyl/myristoyl acyltransferase
MYLYFSKRRALEANLSRVMPFGNRDIWRTTARRIFHNYARYLVDFVLYRHSSPSILSHKVHFAAHAELEEAYREGKGIIFVTLHFGNWDMGAATLTALGYPVNAIVDEFPNSRMERFVKSTRDHLCVRGVLNGRVGPGTLRALQRGEILALAIDRPNTKKGVTVKFFGENVRIPSGPARLALRSGARVMPAVVVRTELGEDTFEAIVDTGFTFCRTGDDERDVAELTQKLVAALEEQIARFPDQWYMFRPMWPSSIQNAGRRELVS